jgi:hypothetical protein
LRRSVDAETDFVMSRAQSMNSSANGLTVRFFTVMMPTLVCCAGNFTGNNLSPMRLALPSWRRFGMNTAIARTSWR